MIFPAKILYVFRIFRCLGLWAAGSRNLGSIPRRGKKLCSFAGLPTPSVEPTHSYSIGTGWGGVYPRSMKLTGYLHIAPRLRISGAVRPHTYTPSWLVQGNFTFTLVVTVVRVCLCLKSGRGRTGIFSYMKLINLPVAKPSSRVHLISKLSETITRQFHKVSHQKWWIPAFDPP